MKWQALLPILALSAWPAVAFAADGGAEADAGEDAGTLSPDDNTSKVPPLECGGDLCDSSNGSTCSLSTPGLPVSPFGLVAAAVFPLAALVRRRRR